MSDSNYQYVYNVHLLDDLHNYFPDILYNQERFQNIRDVLHYIREQTNNRFNLFQHGQNLYNDRDFQPRGSESMNTTNLLLSLLSSRLFNRMSLNPNANSFIPQNFLNPVVVRPTAEQIENNSEIVTDISGQICTICQDSINLADSCRRLRSCNHVFHHTCIDQWFLRSVSCPTCRRDIRE